MKNNHTITHIEIPAPDWKELLNFIQNCLIGKYKYNRRGIMPFSGLVLPKSGGSFDAGLKPAEEKCGLQITIDVDDISVMLEEIEKADGKIILGKTEIPGGHGFYACFRDPNGNYLQLHS